MHVYQFYFPKYFKFTNLYDPKGLKTKKVKEYIDSNFVDKKVAMKSFNLLNDKLAAKSNFEITTASNGQEALDKFK